MKEAGFLAEQLIAAAHVAGGRPVRRRSSTRDGVIMSMRQSTRPARTVAPLRSRSASPSVMAASALIVIVGSLQVGIGWGAEGPRAGFFPFYIGLLIVLSRASVNSVTRRWRRDADELFAEWSQLRQVLAVVMPTAIYVASIPLHRHLRRVGRCSSPCFMRWLGNYGWRLALLGRDRRAGGHLPGVRNLVPGAAAEGAARGSARALTEAAIGRRSASRRGRGTRRWKKSAICFTASRSRCSRSTSC